MHSNRLVVITGHKSDQFFICELVKAGFLIIGVYYDIETATKKMKKIEKKRLKK